MNIIGIDPGKAGGICMLHDELHLAFPASIKDMTEHDINKVIKEFKEMGECHCFIEQVHSAPKQGVVSVFTFGQNYGFWRGLLVAHGIPFEEVASQRWECGIGFKSPRGCSYTERKRLLKQRAEQLFPTIHLTLATADAVLIAEYGRRVLNGRSKT